MEKMQYEKLAVYQIAKILADRIWAIVREWGSFEQESLGNQLLNSSDSISANIAKATVKGRFKDNIRFAKMARSSLFETRHWLRKAFRREFITESQSNELLIIIEDLSPRINVFIKLVEAGKKFGRY